MVNPVRLNPRIRDIPSTLKPTLTEAIRIGKAVDAVFMKEMDKAFKSEGSSTGAKWHPLSPTYAKWKMKLFAGAQRQTIDTARTRGHAVPGGRAARAKWVTKKLGSAGTILQLTGDMMRAFTKPDPPHVMNAVVAPSGILIQVGARGPEYWGWHQDGGPSQGRPPARPIMRFSPTFRKDIITTVSDTMSFMVAQRVRAMMQARLTRR